MFVTTGSLVGHVKKTFLRKYKQILVFYSWVLEKVRKIRVYFLRKSHEDYLWLIIRPNTCAYSTDKLLNYNIGISLESSKIKFYFLHLHQLMLYVFSVNHYIFIFIHIHRNTEIVHLNGLTLSSCDYHVIYRLILHKQICH